MKLACSLAALCASLTAAMIGRAQPPEPPPARGAAEAPRARRPGPAAENALEVSIATGYTQGFGSLESGVGMPSVASAGVGFDLGVGYRIDPRWGVALTGQYHQLTPERGTTARGLLTSIVVEYHFAPARALDPWIEGGAGYRALWEHSDLGPWLATHGFELARARAGLDLRADEHFALGPVVGADATLFLFRNVNDVGSNISDPRLSTFVYAGVNGRFDIGH
jgi:hypothetical protein